MVNPIMAAFHPEAQSSYCNFSHPDVAAITRIMVTFKKIQNDMFIPKEKRMKQMSRVE